jgi:hypothetical protein
MRRLQSVSNRRAAFHTQVAEPDWVRQAHMGAEESDFANDVVKVLFPLIQETCKHDVRVVLDWDTFKIGVQHFDEENDSDTYYKKMTQAEMEAARELASTGRLQTKTISLRVAMKASPEMTARLLAHYIEGWCSEHWFYSAVERAAE